MTKDIFSIVKRPMFTEKGTALKEKDNKVLVEVYKSANKIEIKKAIEEIFKVKVLKISTINTHGRTKRYGKYPATVPGKKKAIVTLKKGEKLDFIEGA